MQAVYETTLRNGKNNLAGLIRSAGFDLPKGASLTADVSRNGTVRVIARNDKAGGRLEQTEGAALVNDPAFAGWNVVRPIFALDRILPRGFHASLRWDADRRAVRARIVRRIVTY